MRPSTRPPPSRCCRAGNTRPGCRVQGAGRGGAWCRANGVRIGCMEVERSMWLGFSNPRALALGALRIDRDLQVADPVGVADGSPVVEDPGSQPNLPRPTLKGSQIHARSKSGRNLRRPLRNPYRVGRRAAAVTQGSSATLRYPGLIYVIPSGYPGPRNWRCKPGGIRVLVLQSEFASLPLYTPLLGGTTFPEHRSVPPPAFPHPTSPRSTSHVARPRVRP